MDLVNSANKHFLIHTVNAVSYIIGLFPILMAVQKNECNFGSFFNANGRISAFQLRRKSFMYRTPAGITTWH
jgi:hypothetical protein